MPYQTFFKTFKSLVKKKQLFNENGEGGGKRITLTSMNSEEVYWYIIGTFKSKNTNYRDMWTSQSEKQIAICKCGTFASDFFQLISQKVSKTCVSTFRCAYNLPGNLFVVYQ